MFTHPDDDNDAFNRAVERALLELGDGGGNGAGHRVWPAGRQRQEREARGTTLGPLLEGRRAVRRDGVRSTGD